ncbi:MAG: gfo/Idh/MocA family oxidoreductase [Thermoprotei archaeon]|nr:MAG: gfo/Idh/MocA family oxidoreductase [Thermoprotei archaeon]
MRKLKFGILSFAHIHAWSYARVLRELEEAELVAIYDDKLERLKRAAWEYRVENTYTDYEQLLKRDDIDAVIITSENAKHAELAVAAAEAGKHMIVEKPLATSLDDAERMIRAAEKAGVKLQQAFVMRYHDATVEVKQMIEKGEIGELLVITTTNHGKYPGLWFGDPELAGGGAVMDHTVHTADLMRWYTGDEVEEVYAVIGRNIRSELKTEDNALISLKFRKGVIGSIDCSWSRHEGWPIWGDVWLGVIGTRGYIVVDAFRTCINLVVNGKPLTWLYFGSDCDRNMISDFIEVVVEDKTPRATGYDGYKALEIALAAYESNRRGEPVKLPLKREL